MASTLEVFNLYDFDETIYGGNCAVDFYWYALRRSPALLRYAPLQTWHLLLYSLKLEDRRVFKENFFIFLRGVKDSDDFAHGFWKENMIKIRKWFLAKDQSTAVIISASPEFLLLPALKQVAPRAVIATHMDRSTGRIIGANCYGPEKVERFRKLYPNAVVQEAYSDHLSDLPMLRLAKKPYVVLREKHIPLEEYRALSRLRVLIMRIV